jgi:aryl-alcohol dehydrogenase-like predicted oxidoreductase
LISPIGFGAFKIGRNQGVKYAQPYELPDDATAERLLNGVLDLGVTYVDTAPAYGLSEERIGRFLAHRRREFVLSTKVGERYENGESTYDFSAHGIRRSMEQSLRRLQTDVLDIVFLHAPRADLPVINDSDTLNALLALRDRGMIRAVGFSGYTAEAFRQAIDWADVLMFEYHAKDSSLEAVITEASAKNKIVIVKKGLASGRIAGYEAIRFALANRGVTSLVIGSLNLQHMADNVEMAQAVRGWQPLRKSSTLQGRLMP